MAQSSFKWIVVYGDESSEIVTSTAEDLPYLVDFCRDIVCIVRIDFSD